MLTENGESVAFIMSRIIAAVTSQCETRSDWLTHLLDPALRQAAAEFARALAVSLGC